MMITASAIASARRQCLLRTVSFASAGASIDLSAACDMTHHAPPKSIGPLHELLDLR
jgi:hypothetical protein